VVGAESAESGQWPAEAPYRGSGGVTCLYFAADEAPVPKPILMLNGAEKGPINNLGVPSAIVPS
jgi:hypothetical protein